jgi:acyl carrier protein
MTDAALDPDDGVAEQVRRIIAEELQVEESRVSPEATIADLGGDSLKALMVVAALETGFDITITDADAATITSFRSAVDCVRRLRSA